MFGLSEQPRAAKEDKGKTLKTLDQSDVSNGRSRPALVKLYSLIAILLLTLGLIVLSEYADRHLPSADQSHYNAFTQGTSSQKSTSIITKASTKTLDITKRLATLSYATTSAIPGGKEFPSYPTTTPNLSDELVFRRELAVLTGTTSSSPVSQTSSSLDQLSSPAASQSATLSSSVLLDSSSLTPSVSISTISTNSTPTSVNLTNLPVMDKSVPGMCISTDPPPCTCPYDGVTDANNCFCTVDSGSNSTACQCSFSGSTETCVCPVIDECTTFLAPPVEGADFWQAFFAPTDPVPADCSCFWRLPAPDVVDTELGCTVVRECDCPLSELDFWCDGIVDQSSSTSTEFSIPVAISTSADNSTFADILTSADISTSVEISTSTEIPISSSSTAASSTQFVPVYLYSALLSSLSVRTSVLSVNTTQATIVIPRFSNSSILTESSSSSVIVIESISSLSVNQSTTALASVSPSISTALVPLMLLLTTKASNGSSLVASISTITAPATSIIAATTPSSVATSSSALPSVTSLSTPGIKISSLITGNTKGTAPSNSQGTTKSSVATVQAQSSPQTVANSLSQGSSQGNTPSNSQGTTEASVTSVQAQSNQQTSANSLPQGTSQGTAPSNSQGTTGESVASVRTQSNPQTSANSFSQMTSQATSQATSQGAASSNSQGTTGASVTSVQAQSSPQTSASSLTQGASQGTAPSNSQGTTGASVASVQAQSNQQTSANSLSQATPRSATPISQSVAASVVSSLLSAGRATTATAPLANLQAQDDVFSASVSSIDFTSATGLLQSDQAKPTLVPSSVSTPGSGDGSRGFPGGAGDGAQNIGAQHWPVSKAFVGGYMPVVLAKLFNIALAAYYHQALDMAPFNNPSASTLLGAPDWHSYIAFAPFIASWATVPFAADAISLDTNYGCLNPDLSNPSNPCWPPKMVANPGVIRILQGSLSFIAVVSCALIGFWFKKPHGTSTDTTSIAAVAAISSHPQMISDFSCPAETPIEEFKKSINGKKYSLGQWTLPDGSLRYGIVPNPQNDDDSKTQRFFPRGGFSRIRGWFQVSTMGWKLTRMIRDGIFLLYILVIVAISASYLKDEGNSAFASLFSGSSFGRRVIFTLLAAVVSFYFSKIERDTQNLAPYMELQRLDATPSTTVLLRRHSLPITSFFSLLKNRHFVPAAVSFTSLLSEFLVITLSGLPYRAGQTRGEFLFCGISSLFILVTIGIMIVVVNIWRCFLPALPRKPESVAAVMTYVVGTRFCSDFEGLERASVSKRDRQIKAMGKRYGFGKVTSSDGNERWIVEDVGVSLPQVEYYGMHQKVSAHSSTVSL